MKHGKLLISLLVLPLLLLGLGSTSCRPAAAPGTADIESSEEEHHSHESENGDSYLTSLDNLTAVDLAGNEKIQVVATTTIAADVAANVGGDLVELTGLFPLGSDPHTYEATPSDYQTMANADVIIINGVGLEEFLSPTLEQISADTPVLSLSDGIDLLEFGQQTHDAEHDAAHEEEEHHTEEEGHDDSHAGHSHDQGYDPHVWFDPANIIHWVETITEAFSALDPANAAAYTANGDAYIEQLLELDEWIRQETTRIDADSRELVTDHLAFSYFAARYDYDMIGAVIPAYSTSAEPSAQELAALIDTIRELNVPVIFVGTSSNPSLAEQASTETGVRLLPVYTGSLSDSSGPAATYIDLMRYNVDSFVSGLSGS